MLCEYLSIDVIKQLSHGFIFRDSVATCLANVHSFVLRDCKQVPWAGDMTPDVTLSIGVMNERRKEQLKMEVVKVPNLPYGKSILQERIRYVKRFIFFVTLFDRVLCIFCMLMYDVFTVLPLG